jgi:hypothetical protein
MKPIVINIIRFSKSDLQPKKYLNSGLENKSPIKDRDDQTNPIGGLDDEDIEQARPAFPKVMPKTFVRPKLPANLQRDTGRTNNVCQLLFFIL